MYYEHLLNDPACGASVIGAPVLLSVAAPRAQLISMKNVKRNKLVWIKMSDIQDR